MEGVQKAHHQVQVHPAGPREQRQEGIAGQKARLSAGQQERIQKFGKTGSGPGAELALKIFQTGKLTVGQLLNGLVRRQTAFDAFHKFPQSFQRLVRIDCSGGRAVGDYRAQVKRSQIARGGIAFQGAVCDGGENLRPTGVFVQPQRSQELFRGHGVLDQRVCQPIRKLLHAAGVISLSGVQKRVQQSFGSLRHAVLVQKQPRISYNGSPEDPVNFLPQLVQLGLKGRTVRFAVSGGFSSQLGHAPKIVLDFCQRGFSGSERPAALPRVGLCLTDPGHQLL